MPGPTFVKSFLRTYAQALGLDGKALVEEYRLQSRAPERGDARADRLDAAAARRRLAGRAGPGGDGPSRGYVIAVSAIGVVIVVLIALLLIGGGGSSNKTPTTTPTTASTPRHTAAKHARKHSLGGRPASTDLVALSLRATGLVYVCLIGDNGRKADPGRRTAAGRSHAAPTMPGALRSRSGTAR